MISSPTCFGLPLQPRNWPSTQKTSSLASLRQPTLYLAPSRGRLRLATPTEVSQPDETMRNVHSATPVGAVRRLSYSLIRGMWWKGGHQLLVLVDMQMVYPAAIAAVSPSAETIKCVATTLRPISNRTTHGHFGAVKLKRRWDDVKKLVTLMTQDAFQLVTYRKARIPQ